MKCNKCGSNKLAKESYILGEVINGVHETKKHTTVACLECRYRERYVEVLDETKKGEGK